VSDPPRPGREPGDPLLRAIAAHWAGIRALASDEQWERVRALVAGIADIAESDAREAYAALADELGDILPPDHEISVMMRTGIMGGATTADAQMLEDLWLLSDLVLDPGESAWRAAHGGTDSGATDFAGTDLLEPPLVDAGFGGTDDFDRLVEERLLSLPSLSPQDARQRGINPNDLRLIRLPRPGAAPEFQLPAFQFDRAGDAWEAWDIVMEVNQVLDAADDPWGVTCWWVDLHARLGDSPVDLLGRGQDSLIRRAARAMVEDY
jgi:hypothetical protein